MSDDPKSIVRDGYGAIATCYLHWSKDSTVRRAYLDKLLALISPGAKVLELGCGAGIPVTVALATHFEVTAVDISPTQIALLHENVPNVTAICADMMSLEFPEGSFDAVAAFYAITHLPREEHGEMLRRIARWLKLGGHLLASMGANDLPGVVEESWLGARNYFSHFDAQSNLSMIATAGLSCIESSIVEQDLVDEKGVHFLWVIARKP